MRSTAWKRLSTSGASSSAPSASQVVDAEMFHRRGEQSAGLIFGTQRCAAGPEADESILQSIVGHALPHHGGGQASQPSLEALKCWEEYFLFRAVAI